MIVIEKLRGLLDGLSWGEKLPVIGWLLESSDEAAKALPILKVIWAETDEATELAAIHELVNLLHPVYWRNPFHTLDTNVIEARFVALGPNPTKAALLATLPTTAATEADGSRLKEIAEFLVDHADEAVQVLLLLFSIFGRKKPPVPKIA